MPLREEIARVAQREIEAHLTTELGPRWNQPDIQRLWGGSPASAGEAIADAVIALQGSAAAEVSSERAP